NAALTVPPKQPADTNRETAATQNDSAILQPKTAGGSTQVNQTASQSMDVASAVKSLVSPTTAVSSTASGPKQDTSVALAVEQLAPKSEKTEASVKPNEATPSLIELRLAPEKSEMRVGEKRQVSVEVKSDAPLGLAVVTM